MVLALKDNNRLIRNLVNQSMFLGNSSGLAPFQAML